MSFVLALDQGTTSCRALLFDQDGNKIASTQKEFTQYFPEPGYVEHDAEEIWNTLCTCIDTLMKDYHLQSGDISCIGITNQRETTVIWDKKTKKPLHRAIVWQDRRTSNQCNFLKKEGYEPLLQEKTGLIIDPYFSSTKMQWLLKKINYQDDIAIGTIDSWLIYKLTGKHLTDVTNASRTQLFNIHTLSWDQELLKLFDIPLSALAIPQPSSSFFGEVSELTYLKGVPICGVAGDQQASLFGQLCLKKGTTKCTYGTGCFMLMNIGNKPLLSKNHLLTTVAFQTQHSLCYALEGSVFMGGALVQWLRDNLNIIINSSDIESLALQVEDTGGVYFVPSFAGLAAPYWNPSVTGAIFGLTRGTQKAHLARAALEAIAFEVFDVIQAMKQDTNLKIPSLNVDGGASKNKLLMQMQANLLNLNILLPEDVEASAKGVAFLAGLYQGIWKNEDNLPPPSKRQIIKPDLSIKTIQEKKHLWKKAIRCAQIWAEEDKKVVYETQ